MSRKRRIAIVNSSSFGRHHQDHIRELEAFAEISRVSVPIDIAAADLIEELKNADGVIASVTPHFSAEVLEGLPALVLLARHGIGCDNVDLAAASRLGIAVSRVDGPVERNAVAEMAVALMMAAGRHVVAGHTAVAEGRWHDRAQFIGLELSGKTVGLIGIGNIGSRVSEILSRGFSVEVLACDPAVSAEEMKQFGAKKVALDEVLSRSDIVSFHCSLNESSRRMITAPQLAQMKQGALLINTCRGELLNENDLIQALERRQLAAYGTDVVEGEPIDDSHQILKAPNVIVLPHLGGYSQESLRGMGDTMVQDCKRMFVSNALPGVLANPEVLDAKEKRWR